MSKGRTKAAMQSQMDLLAQVAATIQSRAERGHATAFPLGAFYLTYRAARDDAWMALCAAYIEESLALIEPTTTATDVAGV